MAISTTYASINTLGDFPFIAGNSYTIGFYVWDQSGSPIDLGAAICKWRMAPYGTDYVVLEKTGYIVSGNLFQILLTPNDTIGLSGKYAHQPCITLSSGKQMLPAQGVITLIKGFGVNE